MNQLCLLIRKEMVYEGNLILVNRTFPIKKEPILENLMPLKNNPSVYLNKQAAVLLGQLLSSTPDNAEIFPVSGFRLHQEQRNLFYHSIRDHGEKYTLKYVALPGCSEHQTGLALDLSYQNSDASVICPEFPYAGICQEIRERMPKFGFIERYPAGKEHMTGIGHEPWHFRYVGYPHSELITRLQMTLEEYIEYIKGYSEKSEHLYYSSGQRGYEIFYVPMKGKETYSLEIPGDCPYQISGNNRDGIIVTYWRCSI